uniref:Matrin-type domain-containing protein n=1 Tax=Arcella intermedia TaxID=1963864 RepID=A0A6B2LEX3_9EUKA
MRQLALETIDLAKDPYFMKNHLGSYECKLCLTLHNNEGSYLAHTQGRRHQMNLARRAARDQREMVAPQPLPGSTTTKVKPRKTIKIGRPGYQVVKERDPETNQLSLQFSIEYPEIEDAVKPRYRFMSAFEQRVESQDKNYQYLLFAAEPYETIAFKIPNKEIEKNVGPQVPGESKFWTKWEEETKTFSLQLHFKPEKKSTPAPAPAAAAPSKSSYDPMQPKSTNPHMNYAYFNK